MIKKFLKRQKQRKEERKNNYKILFDRIYKFYVDWHIAEFGLIPTVRYAQTQTKIQITLARLEGRVNRNYEVVGERKMTQTLAVSKTETIKRLEKMVEENLERRNKAGDTNSDNDYMSLMYAISYLKK